MTGGIYLIQADETLVEMLERPYDTEDVLQELLAKHPRVLGGDQLDGAEPKKWMLISREAPVPSESGGYDRWSMDHFFVDQHAVPTVVEVKRSSDTRIRREVVGQILDYAANSVLYLSVDRIQALFQKDCEDRGDNPGVLLRNLLGDEADEGTFWKDLEANLKAGRLRLIFVADDIPSELATVIEFLNTQMTRTEVLGIEVKQYVDPDQKLRTLVPRVIGQTAEANAAKGTSERGSRWTEDRFFLELQETRGENEVALARDLLKFGEEITGRPVDWGTGKDTGSFSAALKIGKDRFSLFTVYTNGQFSFNLGWSYWRFERDGFPTFSEDCRRKVNDQLGLSVDQHSWERGSAGAPLSALSPERTTRFKLLIQELAEDCRRIAT